MEKMRKNKRILFIVLLTVLFGCARESEQEVKNKLAVILDDDLKAIVSEIPSQNPSPLLDKPYYRITEYICTPKSRDFSHKAVVDFFYLKNIQMKQVRKYRYKPLNRLWERYYKQLEYNLSK